MASVPASALSSSSTSVSSAHAMQAAAYSACIEACLEQLGTQQGALLPVLHALQSAYRHVPSEAVPLIAERLNISRAEVHGVITYYHHFRQQPAGKTVIQLCRAEACQSVGADALAEHASKHIGCDFHETTADGEITLEPVYCLGQCACGPSMMIGDAIHARVTPERFDALIARLRSEA